MSHFIKQIGIGLIIVIPFFLSCNFFSDPEEIPIYLIDTVVVSKDTVIDSLAVGKPIIVSRIDTISVVIFRDPIDTSFIDSITYTTLEREWIVQGLRLVPVQRESLLALRLFVGTDKHRKARPDTLSKTSGQRIKNLANIFIQDSSLVKSTTFPYTVTKPALIPRDLKKFVKMEYFDTVSSPIYLKNPRRDSVVGRLTWGHTLFSKNWDSLYVIWPKDSASKLGLHSGYLNLKQADTITYAEIIYSMDRVFKNLTPKNKNRNDFWSTVGMAERFVETGSIFSMTTGVRVVGSQIFFDSITSLHSRFRLRGNFSFEFTIHRAARDFEGYTLLPFLSADSNPTVSFNTSNLEYDLLAAKSAGLSMTLKNGFSQIKSFSSGDVDNRQKAPQNCRFYFSRKEDTITFRLRDIEAQANIDSIKTYTLKPGDIPEALYIHFIMGHFPTQRNRELSVEFSNFLITEGEIN